VPPIADERTLLEAWLEFHRATLLLKCAGLSDRQLRDRSAPPSTLSLLGLVRHLTDVERAWFRRRLAGETGPAAAPLYRTEQRQDAAFYDVDLADVPATFAAYHEEVARCRAAAAGVPLDRVVGDRSVRWIYLHLIEEYARHNGHADLLRERIDGAKGT
jgi:uncharacterized damage-inducible protein DinB